MNARGGARLLVIVVTTVIAAVVGAAIVIIDPPTQRARSIDDRRINDLRAIENRIEVYWPRHGALPPDLDALARELGGLPADPETGATYEYEVTAERSYRLCATFALEPPSDERGSAYRDRWIHRAGRFCFDLQVEARASSP